MGRRDTGAVTPLGTQQLKGQRKLESNFVSRLDSIGGCKVSNLNTSMLASLFLSFFLLLPSSFPLPSFLSPSCPLLFLLLDHFFLFVKTGSHFVGQISLKLWILLTQHPR